MQTTKSFNQAANVTGWNDVNSSKVPDGVVAWTTQVVKLFSCSFQNANFTYLESYVPDSGQGDIGTWRKVTTTYIPNKIRLYGGRVYKSDQNNSGRSSNPSICYINNINLPADYIVRADIWNFGDYGSGDWGVLGNGNDPDDGTNGDPGGNPESIARLEARWSFNFEGYRVEHTMSTGVWNLTKQTGSEFGSVLATFTGSITPGDFAHVEWLLVGSTQKVYIDGVLRMSVSDSTYLGTSGDNAAGIRFDGGVSPVRGLQIDNYQILPATDQSMKVFDTVGTVPAGNIVTGILVRVKGAYSGPGITRTTGGSIPTETPDAEFHTLRIRLSKDGTTKTGYRDVELPYSLDFVECGSPTDLWGTAFSASEVNSSVFTVFVDALRSEVGESITNRYIDYVEIIVYHNQAGGSLMSIREIGRQNVLLGREVDVSDISTPGVQKPATIRLRMATIDPQPNAERMTHTPAGDKLVSHRPVLREHSEGPIAGIPSYDELGYFLQSLIGRPNTTTLATGVYQHTFRLNNRTRDNVMTYTLEYGDQYSRTHRTLFTLINQLGLGFRQNAVDLTGSILAQTIADKEADGTTDVAMSAGVATVQTVTQSGTGTFRLVFMGAETSDLTAGAGLTASAIQTALRALAPINGSTQLTVAGSAGGPFTVTFGNALSGPFKGMPQPLLEFRVITPTPVVAVAMTTRGGYTELPGIPILPGHVELFLTDVYANLAANKLADAFVSDFDMGAKYTPYHVLDRTYQSFKNYAEKPEIDVNFKLSLHANSNGMQYLGQARADTQLFFRLLATGPVVASSINHALQIDMPFKFGSHGPFGGQQDLKVFEYMLGGTFDTLRNESLVIKLTNGVSSY